VSTQTVPNGTLRQDDLHPTGALKICLLRKKHRTWLRVTTLIKTTALPLTQTGNQDYSLCSILVAVDDETAASGSELQTLMT